MDIVVCIKQVPDVEGRIVVDRGTITVQGLVPSRPTNPLDLLALEAAVRLKEDLGGNLTVVSLGDSRAEEALRKGIAMGADNAVLLTDQAFEGGDSFATATALARAIAPMPHDLVICGRRADDTLSGQVGALLAELLGLALVQGVVGIETASPERLRLLRKLEKGNRQVIECALPALLTMETGVNTPRNPGIKGVLKARNARIARRGATDLGLTEDEVGLAGSRTELARLSPPKPKMKGLFVPDSKLSSAEKLKQIMGGGIVQKKGDLLESDPEDVARQLLRFFQEQKIITAPD